MITDNPNTDPTAAPVQELQNGERPCDVLSEPPAATAGAGPVEIYWEYQAGRPAHKFSRAIRCF